MNDEQKEKKPTQKFSSIQKQFETIGGGRETQERQDVLTSKRQETVAMKRQTVYMPAGLARWLKVHAAATGSDISSIITDLVVRYRDEVDKK